MMDETDYIRSMLHRPYNDDSFTCWHLVVDCQLKVFGRRVYSDMPKVACWQEYGRIIHNHPERANWVEVDRPRPGSVAMFRKVKFELHAGVWLSPQGGVILHCDKPHGVVYDDPELLLGMGTGLNKIRYYEPRT